MKTAAKKISDGFSLMPGLVTGDGVLAGYVKIYEGAVASIVKHAVGTVEGVTRLSGSSFVDNLAEIVGSRKIKDRSIQIQIAEDTVSVEVSVNVAYGVHLPTVCAEVQHSVSDEIRRLTGLKVGKVNVVVREMEELQDEKSGS